MRKEVSIGQKVGLCVGHSYLLFGWNHPDKPGDDRACYHTPCAGGYQIFMRSSGFLYCLSPGLILKASYHASMLTGAPIVLYSPGE
jgi:hypothetical protein